MSDYTPSLNEAREAYQFAGDGADFKRRFNERGIEFDRMIEAVRAEEREKAAQIAEDSYEDQPTWLRNGIAARIRNQKAGE